MEIREIRLKNFLALSDGYKTKAQFCSAIDMQPSYFSQIKRGDKAIGDDIARKVEEKLGLPRGYMDAARTPNGVAEAGGTIPSETLGLAYALETLPRNIRDSLSRLIYTLAAEARPRQADIAGADDVIMRPFNVLEGSKNAEDRPAQEERNGSHRS